MDKITVKNGIDNIGKYAELFKGLRIGLITNPTGVGRELRTTWDILSEACDLRALFSPEHGIRGNLQAGEKVEQYSDEVTGLPVFSLYGANRKPTPEMLEDIDMLVYDIQDIGTRYYTFIYTMALAMQSCVENGKAFTVLDRVNPIGGCVEGNILDSGFKSFTGMYPLPVRYGLTTGELAVYLNSAFGIGARLEVVRIEGWKRDAFFDETDLPWINPTPNMTCTDAAILYGGTCLFEGTNVSEGRGTTRPFEIIGAPWINPCDLAERMNGMHLPGVVFRPLYFEPVFSKYRGEVCGGVQLHVAGRRKVRPFEYGLRLLQEIRSGYSGEFTWTPPNATGHYFIDMLAGTDKIRLGGPGQGLVDAMLPEWREACAEFSLGANACRMYD